MERESLGFLFERRAVKSNCGLLAVVVEEEPLVNDLHFPFLFWV